MQIYGPFRLSTAQPTNPAGNVKSAAGNRLGADQAGPKSSAGPIDQLDLSSAARGSEITSTNRLSESTAIAGGGEIRIDRVAELRRQIANGSYETPEKLDMALERLLDDFA